MWLWINIIISHIITQAASFTNYVSRPSGPAVLLFKAHKALKTSVGEIFLRKSSGWKRLIREA